MKITFYSTFREAAGVRTLDLETPGPVTVNWVISRLLQDFPGLRRLWLDKNGELMGHVHIGLNQVDVMVSPEKLETMVSDQDTLDFFPPITGG